MRPLLIALALGMASTSPVLAQADPAQVARENDLWAQQQLQNQRAVALENQMNALDARLGAEVRLRELRDQARRPAMPEPYVPKSGAALNLGPFPSIPDEALAASNRRVREASENRR
ncbi:hypothetical protein M9M90_17040 [Phenylobacterium sp. LH3H17]|uniref:hypothetical protein n=1 Tax=Phenylobacterium sp. LH3H17 TaxID=2903901 RepID=UPI0020C98E9D|nr:hypothetical protein [Phenylobacterium sp. LH3H17]UTP38910.1 hypothetical protein M9M90_17040 [Phenylobacterium sp. LH3H17]